MLTNSAIQNQNQVISSGPNDLLGQTTRIVAAYVVHNAVPATSLPQIIADVHTALSKLSAAPAATDAAGSLAKPSTPAVAVNRSVTPEYIVCLEDGKKFKSLKRHLRTHYGLTPDEYRRRWGLPGDYPMTAPAYSDRRAALAKQSGLGRKAA